MTSEQAERRGQAHGFLRFLVFVFVLAATGSLALVAVDLLVGGLLQAMFSSPS